MSEALALFGTVMPRRLELLMLELIAVRQARYVSSSLTSCWVWTLLTILTSLFLLVQDGHENSEDSQRPDEFIGVGTVLAP
jgi:hypothetical protein